MQDVGSVRKLPRKNQFWCIVCDGIGGQPGGAEAANICVNTYDHFLRNSLARKMVDKTVDFLKLGMLPVMDAFYSHMQHNPAHEHMGCTFALAYVEENIATLCWCGDSRIYVFRNGRMYFKSLPHNPAFDDYREGKISLKQAENHKTNIITRSISVEAAFPILEFKKVELQSGDKIMVCTDGVCNKISSDNFKNLAKTDEFDKTINQLKKELIKEAEDNYWGWIGEVIV